MRSSSSVNMRARISDGSNTCTANENKEGIDCRFTYVLIFHLRLLLLFICDFLVFSKGPVIVVAVAEDLLQLIPRTSSTRESDIASVVSGVRTWHLCPPILRPDLMLSFELSLVVAALSAALLGPPHP